MDLSDLKEFLDFKNIPVIKNKTGFLEIIKKQHRENVNSNLYAHFLSCEIPEIRSLFLDSLLSLVIERIDKNLSFANQMVSTEVPTTNGRIDIVIEDFGCQNTIIIENKIYHHLNNDLLEYWNHYKTDDSKKVGVLLTLYHHELPECVAGKFINITHLQWISRVKESYQPESLPNNYKVYIEDFLNTIENLTRTNIMNDSARFYFENASKVIKANETLSQAHIFLNNQYELIANKIGWQTFGSNINWKNFWDQNNELDTYLTIITQDIVKGHGLNFTLILELNRNDKKREADITEKFKHHPQFVDKRHGKSEGSYVHFLCKEYPLTIDELAHFSDLVVEKINDDFAEITVDVIKFLYPDTDISKFENQFTK